MDKVELALCIGVLFGVPLGLILNWVYRLLVPNPFLGIYRESAKFWEEQWQEERRLNNELVLAVSKQPRENR